MRLHVTRHTAAYWRVTIDNPPLNLFDPEMANELSSLLDVLEQDEQVKVVVFDSAHPDFFIAHVDLLRSGEFDLSPKPSTGLAVWPDAARRLELAPFLTVGLIRGRTRAVGSEFIQALDVRFASKEKAVFAQIEIGCGLFPGGGGLERLPPLVGRARALEIIVGGDDFDADTAALYGWINRAVPDAELDAFVDRFAKRVASFERKAIAIAKQTIYERMGLAPVDYFQHTESLFFEAIQWPATQQRIAEVIGRGFQQPGDFELNLASNLGPEDL